MNVKNKRILVTGADGFIGSHLVEYLVAQGAKVQAFVYYNAFNSWGWLDTLPKSTIQSIQVFGGDVRDLQSIKHAAKDCDVIFHLAALIAIPYSYIAAESYIDTNVKGTLNVLQVARDFNIEKVIHTSTSEVYGTAQTVPITEQHPLNAQSPYAASKIAADQLALSFYAAFGLPVAIARPFNTYGPRQSARAVIPTIISQLVNNQKIIELGATHPTRDFNYVSDTVKGLVAIMEADDSVGEVINIGSNFEVSIYDTAMHIAELMQTEIEIKTKDERLRPANSEVDRLLACNQKAKVFADWHPEFGGIEGFRRGLEKTIEWFSCQENLARYKVDQYCI